MRGSWFVNDPAHGRGVACLSGGGVGQVQDRGVVLVDPGDGPDRPVGAAGGELGVAFPLLGAVGQVQAGLVSGRQGLEAGGPRKAQPLIATQRAGNVGSGLGQAGRQRRSILDRLGGALGDEGQHGMAGVPEQRHLAQRPALQRGAVEQGGAEGVVGPLQDGKYLGVPAGEGGLGVGEVATFGSRLAGPGVLLDDGDEAEQALVSDEVVDEMPTRPHPELGGHLQLEVGQPARRDQPAVGDAAVKCGSWGPNSRLRTVEWMPSAPTSTSTSAWAPLAKVA